MFSTDFDLAGADATALEKVQLAKITSPQAPYGRGQMDGMGRGASHSHSIRRERKTIITKGTKDNDVDDLSFPAR